MSAVEVCPVCAGRGNVPAGFYSGGATPPTPNPETCRSCAGRGYVPITVSEAQAEESVRSILDLTGS